jgi:hypothetical protein
MELARRSLATGVEFSVRTGVRKTVLSSGPSRPASKAQNYALVRC